MRKWFYTRLAFSNMVKNRRTFVPYVLTAIITVAMCFMMAALTFDKGLDSLPVGAGFIRAILGLGIVIVGIFAAIFLFYTHSFLIKRRKKEMGLFNILGMEKKHLFKLMCIETLATAFISIVLGLLSGMLFSKLAALLLYRIIGGELSFMMVFSPLAFILTGFLFLGIFFLTLLHSLWQVHLSNPIALLKGGQVGEREPKNKWVLTVLGILSLGTGYYLALSVKNPVSALAVFFIAVILVILGTYLLFTAGSITLLKALRKNRRYYYKTNHFISVSGMLYRMKQNAVGLANICILSTMVLVMMSTTTSLIVGLEDALMVRCPYEFSMSVDNKDSKAVHEAVERVLWENGAEAADLAAFRSLAVLAAASAPGAFDTTRDALDNLKDLYQIVLLPQADFTAITGLGGPLGENEVMVFSDTLNYTEPMFSLTGQSWRVAVNGQTALLNRQIESFITIYPYLYVVVPDIQTLNAVGATLEKPPQYALKFDTMLDVSAQTALAPKLRKAVAAALRGGDEQKTISFSFESRAQMRPEIVGMYAGFFFLGLFLGLLFLMATVLILYYKQISEGYDDRGRFHIMQNVGLSRDEARKAIRSQTVTLFFLPLLSTFVHLAFAFPMIRRIMLLMNMPESAPFLEYTVLACAVFSVFYVAVYLLTARTYTKTVSERQA